MVWQPIYVYSRWLLNHAAARRQFYHRYARTTLRIQHTRSLHNTVHASTYRQQSSHSATPGQRTTVDQYDADTFFSRPAWSLHQLYDNHTDAHVEISEIDLSRLYDLSMLDGSCDVGGTAAVRGMIAWMSQLTAADTADVEPIYTPLQCIEQQQHRLNDNDVNSHHPYRADVVSDGDVQSGVLRNAANTDRGFVVVPKVVDLQ